MLLPYFAMPKPEEGKVVYAQTKDMQGNVVVIELSKVTAEIEPKYTKQIGAQLSNASAQQDLTVVLNELRAQADIEYYVISTQP